MERQLKTSKKTWEAMIWSYSHHKILLIQTWITTYPVDHCGPHPSQSWTPRCLCHSRWFHYEPRTSRTLFPQGMSFYGGVWVEGPPSTSPGDSPGSRSSCWPGPAARRSARDGVCRRWTLGRWRTCRWRGWQGWEWCCLLRCRRRRDLFLGDGRVWV